MLIYFKPITNNETPCSQHEAVKRRRQFLRCWCIVYHLKNNKNLICSRPAHRGDRKWILGLILVLTSCFGYGDFAVTRMKSNTRMEEKEVFSFLFVQSGSVYRSSLATSGSESDGCGWVLFYMLNVLLYGDLQMASLRNLCKYVVSMLV